MSLLSFFPLTPSKRQLRRVVLSYPYNKLQFKLTKFKNKNRSALTGAKLVHGVKYQRKVLLHPLFSTPSSWQPFIIMNFGFRTTPLREFSYIKTLYNVLKLTKKTPCFYPGFTLQHFTSVSSIKGLTSQITPLWLVPLNLSISFIFNHSNKKPTFATSSGVVATKRKLDKKTKLFIIILPSLKQQFLPKHTLCTLAPTTNLLINKQVEGKWGTFVTFKKHIVVRGVAQNPVDHCNGGRTKAKQPELSPWGWIAKHSK